MTFVGDDDIFYDDAGDFLDCIREELPYRDTTGFRYEVLTDDPTNLNVLPESGVRTRVTALLNVLKTSAEMELLALDSKESYQDNRLYYLRRTEEECNPAIRALLAQDRRHLDDVQTMMASSRQFCFVLRRRKADGAINLATVEQRLRDSGFTVRRVEGAELLELLAIYFEQDATHEAFDLVDGAHWLTAEMEEENADFES